MENMDTDLEQFIENKLLNMKDDKYRDFTSKLIPTVEKSRIIGVRTPDLRKFAKEIFKEKDYKNFLDHLPHKYYEENNLHGFIIENIKDYNLVIYYLEKFFPYIDNWSTCDLISPKIFKKHLPELIFKIKEWINSDQIYSVRFGIEMLMTHYLGDNFLPEYLNLVADIKSDEYYINMMIAWYFATALAKQYDFAIKYIENKKLGKWVHNKSIQKALESRRISINKKEYLKTLKIK